MRCATAARRPARRLAPGVHADPTPSLSRWPAGAGADALFAAGAAAGGRVSHQGGGAALRPAPAGALCAAHPPAGAGAPPPHSA
eukprot:6711981-Prymnesium_polylepis.2